MTRVIKISEQQYQCFKMSFYPQSGKWATIFDTLWGIKMSSFCILGQGSLFQSMVGTNLIIYHWNE